MLHNGREAHAPLAHLAQAAAIHTPDGPNWAEQITAWSTLAMAVLTLLLVLGVAFAAGQFFLTRKFNRTLETDQLLKEIASSALWATRSRLDKFDSVTENRRRAYRLYKKVQRFGRFKRFRGLAKRFRTVISEIANLTERVEIYIRKGMADESIVAEHTGYNILSTYCFLADVFEERALLYDYNYDGVRDLALRIQDYAILNPKAADLREELVWHPLPPLKYKGGDVSLGYSIAWWAVFRKTRLWWRRKRRPG
jgi:hypothetical protein